MNTGFLLIMALLIFPLFAFFYAVIPEIRPKRIDEFLYSGLTYSRVIMSTVGTLFTVGFFFNAIIGTAGLYGSVPLLGLLLGALFLYPVALYTMITSRTVRDYFSTLSTTHTTQTAFLSFMTRNYHHSTALFFFILFFAMYLGLLFVESGYILMWIEHIFRPYFAYPWLVCLFLLTVCFCYVLVGGYRQVLRTDKLQVAAIAVVLGVILFEVASVRSAIDGSYDLGQTFTSPLDQLYDRCRSDGGQDLGCCQSDPDKPAKCVPLKAAPLEMAAYSFVGAVLFVGILFLTSADVWIRLMRSMYVERQFANDYIGIRHSRWTIGFFLIVPGLMFLLFLLPGAIGVFGYLNTEAIGDRFPSKNPEGPFPYNEIQFWTIRYIKDVVPETNELLAASTYLFSSFSEFVLVVSLAALSLAVMTTLDTALITISQLYSDYRIEKSRRRSVDGCRAVMLLSFNIVIVLVFGLYAATSDELFTKIVQYVGIIVGTLAMVILFVITVRILSPGWMKGRGASMMIVVLGGLMMSTVCWVVLWAMPQPIPLLEFELDIGFNFGRILLISVVVYVGVFLAFRSRVLVSWSERFDRKRERRIDG